MTYVSTIPPKPAACVGERTIAHVDVDLFTRVDGKLDRRITATRDCGHPYEVSYRIDDDPPEVGDRAATCLGPPIDELVKPTFGGGTEGTIFDLRKRPTKKRLPRKGEAGWEPRRRIEDIAAE